MLHSTERITTHTTALVIQVVEHWLEREIAHYHPQNQQKQNKKQHQDKTKQTKQASKQTKTTTKQNKHKKTTIKKQNQITTPPTPKTPTPKQK